ncbi:MAG: hypothetical protein ABIN95_00690, partial [Mucilaginibacter sp.]
MKNKWIPAVLIVLASAVLLSFSKADDDPIKKIATQLDKWLDEQPQEKIHLHLDKPYYAVGEDIWFKAYVTAGSDHRLSALSGILNVELINDRDSIKQSIKIPLTSGLGWGDLNLADTLKEGNYRIRAYTNWMRNAGDEFIYSRRLSVWPASPIGPQDPARPNPNTTFGRAQAVAASRPDVQFFAEGGDLIEGLPAVVAFKATDASGRSLSVRGQLLNAQNAVVVPSFSSRHAGMGRFAFVPGAGQHYHARLTLPNGSTTD